MKRITPFVLVTVLLCGPVAEAAQETPQENDAAAQDAAEDAAEPSGEVPPSEEQVDPVVTEGQALLEKLAAAKLRIDDLEARAAELSGEDARALELQIADAKIQGLDVISQLVANLVAQESKGIDATAVRREVEDRLTRLHPAIVRNIESASAEVSKLRGERDSAAVQDLQAFELRIARRVHWLDTLFEVYAEYIHLIRKAGLDETATLDDLTRRIVARADLLEGQVGLVTEQLAQKEKQAADNPDDPTHEMMIQALETRKQTSTGALSELAGLMDRFGIDSSRYRKLLIRSTGEVTTDVFRRRVFTGLVQDWIEDGRVWLNARGPAIGFRVVVFVMILILFALIARVVRFLVSRRVAGSKVRKSLLVQRMLEGLAGRVIVLLGFLVALSTLGIEIGPLLAGLGIVGFIVGFALQDSLSNFAAGIMILGYRPYDIDDFVEAGGVKGLVSDMSLVSTTILTIDNQTLIVPNAKIWGDVIRNITHQSRRRVDMKFRVAYTDDVDVVERILMEIITNHEKVLEDPAPSVRLHELGEFSMEIIVRPWVKTSDYWEVYWDVTREVKRRFDAEGITIPLPQREVYMHKID